MRFCSRRLAFMCSRPLTFLSLFMVLAAFGLLAAQKATEIKTEDDFEIEGIGGTCFAADFAHINRGHYGKTRLDGLNMVLVGNLVDTKQERLFGTLYLDKNATQEQHGALQQMFEYLNSQNVGLPGEQTIPIKQVKTVAFRFSESTDKTLYTLSIPGILEEKVVLERDATGKPVYSMAAMDTWSNIVHNADNRKFKYHDSEAGKAWAYSGRYANVKYFELTKDMYVKGQMLMLGGDMSGKWTPKQKELIKRLGLEKN